MESILDLKGVPGKLVAIDGPIRGAILAPMGSKSVIGRDPSVEIVIPDSLVSRRHAAVELHEGQHFLRDLGSTNATYLNGLSVTGPRRLEHGDEIVVGRSHFVYLRESTDDSDHGAASVPSLDTSKIDESQPTVAFASLASATPGNDCLVGRSASLKRVSELVARCAPLNSTILVTGESGTGKELVARALHRQAARRREPFVVVNCATLEPTLLESELFGHERGAFTGAVAKRLGKLELVGAGTLFLDEVGELPAQAQAKLLRAIDQRQFERLGGTKLHKTDARFVAATHCELEDMVEAGTFREDLLFRLKVVEIAIDPLRERPDDVVPIAQHFITELRKTIPTKVRGFTPEALAALQRYRFPGNVRELRNVVERCLIFCEGETIDTCDLPVEVRGTSPQATSQPCRASFRTLEEAEREQIALALERTRGNKTKAARLLGIDRVTLYAKLKRHSG